MKFKIPKIKIQPAKTNDPEDAVAADNPDEIFEELEQAAPADYAEQPPEPKASSFSISEAQLRKVWAGEIAFGLLASVATVIIAFIG